MGNQERTQAEADRLAQLLTRDELADPETVERAREGLARADLKAWEHEVAHETVALLLGAGYEQSAVGEGVVEGTLFQRAVTSAAGPVWDQMNDHYIRTSPADEAGIRAGEDAGYDRAFLLSVARAVLGLHTDHVRRVAGDTLPPGPIQELSGILGRDSRPDRRGAERNRASPTS